MSQKKKRKNNTVIIVLIIALVLVFCGIGAFAAYQIHKSGKQAEEEVKEPEPEKQQAEPLVESAPPEEPEETVPQKIDFQALWAVNTDAYAFIEVPGTQVYYPIMQSTSQEEDYYLNVTFENVAGLPGSIYTQKINAKDFSDPITLIYGHDMLDGSYFGELKNYIDRGFFDTYRDIFIYLPERQLQYQIIAEVVFDDKYIPAAYEFYSANVVMTFMQDLQNIQEPQNQFAEDLSLTSEDRLIVLSTCIGDRPNNRRLIVAKLVDDKKVETAAAAPAQTQVPLQ